MKESTFKLFQEYSKICKMPGTYLCVDSECKGHIIVWETPKDEYSLDEFSHWLSHRSFSSEKELIETMKDFILGLKDSISNSIQSSKRQLEETEEIIKRIGEV